MRVRMSLRLRLRLRVSTGARRDLELVELEIADVGIDALLGLVDARRLANDGLRGGVMERGRLARRRVGEATVRARMGREDFRGVRRDRLRQWQLLRLLRLRRVALLLLRQGRLRGYLTSWWLIRLRAAVRRKLGRHVQRLLTVREDIHFVLLQFRHSFLQGKYQNDLILNMFENQKKQLLIEKKNKKLSLI